MEYPKEIAETVHGGQDRIATRQHRVIGAPDILNIWGSAQRLARSAELDRGEFVGR